jgi:hypothetical protein
MMDYICAKNFTHMRTRNSRFFNPRLNTFCLRNPEDESGLILFILLAKSRGGWGERGAGQLTSSSLLDAKKTIITPLLELRVNQPQLEPSSTTGADTLHTTAVITFSSHYAAY